MYKSNTTHGNLQINEWSGNKQKTTDQIQNKVAKAGYMESKMAITDVLIISVFYFATVAQFLNM